jgi:hypothetical protein
VPEGKVLFVGEANIGYSTAKVCFEPNWRSGIRPSLEALRPAMQDGCDEFDKGMRR